ncbi:hypothetical protein JAAARDRAFT_195714 [Jaapia argillacea MUCL 33604]|uniref:Transmembrane protein n=1 Tax=Jaapia argillacea MUCL 33604 TaxID=933084 RepID=A0A067PNC9_9AGAM|nr:hypothetical protein JAAARDRAFT_195714 [Jaapia argillacea MUCL 33604]
MALIASELMILWAMKQWFCARRIAKDHSGAIVLRDFLVSSILIPSFRTRLDEDSWLLCSDGRVRGKMEVPLAVILPNDLNDLVEFPPVTSKQHLPITELEIATLTFTILNLTTYSLWWNKPTDVRCPYPIREKPTIHDGEVLEGGDEAANRSRGGGNGFVRLAIRLNSGVRAVFSRAWDESVMDDPLPMDFVALPFFVLVNGFLEPFFTPKNNEDRPTRVPTFYAGDLEDKEDSLIAWSSALIASVFGAIHCFAWSLQFPSHTQQLVWRISAVTITSAPLLAVAIFHFRDAVSTFRTGFNLTIIFSLTTLISITYVVARITLLVLAFMSLRSLPSGAYETVYWTTFIPHL